MRWDEMVEMMVDDEMRWSVDEIGGWSDGGWWDGWWDEMVVDEITSQYLK